MRSRVAKKCGAYLGICAGTAVAVSAAAGTLPVTGPLVSGGGALVSTVIGLSAPAGTAATIIGTTAAGTGTVAGVTIGATLQSTAVIAATAGAVESAAVGTALFFGAIPFLP